MLEMLKKSARSQKEAARASRHAWIGLREGMYGVTSFCERMNEQNGELLLRESELSVYQDGNLNDISSDLHQMKNDSLHMAKIVPVDHKYLSPYPLEQPLPLSSFDNKNTRDMERPLS